MYTHQVFPNYMHPQKLKVYHPSLTKLRDYETYVLKAKLLTFQFTDRSCLGMV